MAFANKSARLDYLLKQGLGGIAIMQLTQAEYDAITTPDPNTLYIIVG